jgi:hypothetical protein
MQILHYDWWQCGLLAHNGLANLYLPDQNPLLSSDHLQCDLGRMKLFWELVQCYHNDVCQSLICLVKYLLIRFKFSMALWFKHFLQTILTLHLFSMHHHREAHHHQ